MVGEKKSVDDWIHIMAKRCSGKKKFKTQTNAIIFASETIRKKYSDVAGLRAYQCESCKFWHLTKQV